MKTALSWRLICVLFVYDINISIYSMVARIFEIELVCVFFFSQETEYPH